MRKHLVALLAACGVFAAPAMASAALSGSDYPHTAPYAIYPATSSAALVVSPRSAEFVGIINTNTAAQTVVYSCYDNASAASGTPLWSGTLGASQIVTIPGFGVQTLNGITCGASAATLSGNPILVIWR